MLHTAIFNLYPDTKTITDGDAFDADNTPIVINQGLVDAEVIRLQAESDTTQYQRDRIYPSLQDQVDMQYHDLVNSTTTWKDAIAAVKAAHPKP
jgi:hypothetical protein